MSIATAAVFALTGFALFFAVVVYRRAARHQRLMSDQAGPRTRLPGCDA